MDIEALIESLPERLSLVRNEVTGKGVSRREVSEVEEMLGVRFPNSFVAFLCKYGWAELGYFQLFGMGEDVPEQLKLTRNTYDERARGESAVPKHLVPIMRDGAGNLYCLDCRRIRDNECPVVFWDAQGGPSQTPPIVAEDYLTWLFDELDEVSAQD